MFIGHFAVAFAAKKAVPGVSLGTLFAGCQLADLVWPILLLAGVERVEIHPGDTAFTPLAFTHYPYSHSAVALALWALGFAALYAMLRRAPWRAVAVLAALVMSHWLLDFVAHRPDLPLTLSGEARYGLGLWNSVAATLAVESLLFAAGLYLYLRGTAPVDRIGRHGLWGLVAFLVLIWLSAAFGPPPPATTAIAGAGLAMWLLVAWAYWVDRHRR